jgi:hypothetical protein
VDNVLNCFRFGFLEDSQTTLWPDYAVVLRSLTSSRFERRVPAGRHDRVFEVVFGSNAAAARIFGVTKMQVWRWRHDRSPLPERVIRAMPDLLQNRVAEACEARQAFRDFLCEPPSGRALLVSHPIQLDDGRIVFVKRRRRVGRRA